MRRLVASSSVLAVALVTFSPLSPLPAAGALTSDVGVSSQVAGGGNGWTGPASRARLVHVGRVDAAPDGSVLVTQPTHVLRVRPSGDFLEVVAGVGSSLSSAELSGVRDVAASGADVIVATDAGVQRIAADGSRTSLLSSTDVRAIDVGSDGVVWVAQVNSVLRISAGGTVFDVTPEHPFSWLTEIAVSPDGTRAFVIDSSRWGIYPVTAAGVGTRVAGNGEQAGSLAPGTPATSAPMADATSLTTDGTIVTVAMQNRLKVVSFPVGGNLREIATANACSGSIDRVGTGYVVMCGTALTHPSVHGMSGGGVDEGRLLGADPARLWSPDGVRATDAYLESVRGASSDPGGHVVFTTAAGLVREVDAAGILRTRAALAPLTTGGKVAVGPDGTAYVVTDAGAVMSVATSGAAAAVPMAAVASDVEVRPTGRLVVADKGAHRVIETSPGGGPVTVLTDGIGTPSDIGLDGDGVLVADDGLRRVGPDGSVATLLTGGSPTNAARGADGVWTGNLHHPGEPSSTAAAFVKFAVLLPTGELSPVYPLSHKPGQIQAEVTGTMLVAGDDGVTRVTDAGLPAAGPAPANLTATPGSGSVVLSWDVDPSQPPFSNVIVRAKRGAVAPADMWDGEQILTGPDWVREQARPGAAVFRVGSELLKPGEQWTFAVFAKTMRWPTEAVVVDAWSRAAVASAASDLDLTPPPGPVKPAVYVDQTKIFLSWSNPTYDDYDHTVARMSLGAAAPRTPDEGVEILRSQPGELYQSVEIKEPVQGQEYAISVFTVDLHGLYTQWSTVNHLDFDAPAQVTDLAVTPTYLSASFRFTPPSEPDYDGVLYAVAEGDATPAVPSGPISTSLPLSVSALKMNTDYTLAVWSHDQAGNVSAPQLTRFTTLLDADLPSAVTNLAAVGGDYLLTASWTPPTDADLKGVELRLVDDGDGTVRTLQANATDGSKTFTALPGGHDFTLTATARDLQLNLSTPVTISATTLPDGNGAPPASALEGILIRTLSSTRVEVSFRRPILPDLAEIRWGLVPHGQPTADVLLADRFALSSLIITQGITLPEPLTSFQLVVDVIDLNGHVTRIVVPDIHGVASAAELPGLPSALTVTSPVDNVLEVRFGRPTYVTAMPTSWLVTATAGAIVRTQTLAVTMDGSPAFGGTRFVDLPGRLTWSVSVVGVNALGQGPANTVGGVLVPDMTPPAPVTRLALVPAYDQAALTWVNPTNFDFDHVVVRRLGATSAETLVIYTGRGTSARAVGLVAGRGYAFEVRSYDRLGNIWLPGVTVTTSQSVVNVTAPTSVLYGGVIRLTGTLFWDGGPLHSRPVALFAQKTGSTVWTRLATATTVSTGAYGFSVKPLVNTRYRVGYQGAGVVGGAYSIARAVSVRPTVSISGNKSSMSSGSTVTLSTSVAPSHRGSAAYLQRWNGSAWVAVTSRTLSSTSTASAAVRVWTRGRTSFRWVLPAHRDHGLGVSRSFTISVW